MPGSSIISFSAAPALGGPSREPDKGAFQPAVLYLQELPPEFGERFCAAGLRQGWEAVPLLSPRIPHEVKAVLWPHCAVTRMFGEAGSVVKTRTLGRGTAPAVVGTKRWVLTSKCFSTTADRSRIGAQADTRAGARKQDVSPPREGT